MLTRQQIRQFLAVVDTGNFSRAADAIGVTQPTLSSGIAELEGQVGARLFERQRPTVRLTSAGNRLLPVARRIAREFQRAEQETARAPAANRAFQLGVIPSFSTRLLEAACTQWVATELVVSERDGAGLRRELRDGRLDAAVIALRGSEADNIQFFELAEEDFCLMLPATHRLADMTEVCAEELADEVMIARRSCEMLGETSRFFTARGVRPNFSFKSQNDDRAMALVAAGLGLTVAPRSLVRDGVRALRLVDFDTTRHIGLAVRADDYRLGGAYSQRCQRLLSSLRTATQP